MGNPYSGQQPYEAAWDHGYQHGSQNPGDTEPAAPDFSSWELDEQTRGYVEQIWREGALAGRDESQGDSSSELPYYDSASDTLYADAEEFPALVFLAQCGDIDTWLTEIGIDPSVFADGEPVA